MKGMIILAQANGAGAGRLYATVKHRSIAAGSRQEGTRTFPEVGNWPEIPEGQVPAFSFDLPLFSKV